MGTIVFVSITVTGFAVLIAWLLVNTTRSTSHRGAARVAVPSLARQGRHRATAAVQRRQELS